MDTGIPGFLFERIVEEGDQDYERRSQLAPINAEEKCQENQVAFSQIGKP